MSAWIDMISDEDADVLGISLDAVKKRFSRAKKALANEFNRMDAKRMKSPAAQKGGAW